MEAVPYTKFSPSSSGTARSFTTQGQWLRFRVHVAQLSEIASLGCPFSAGRRVNPKTHHSKPATGIVYSGAALSAPVTSTDGTSPRSLSKPPSI
jgi:hypothetical protein